MSYTNSKGLIFSIANGYHLLEREVIPLNISQAVKERILELCREHDISINKLCNGLCITIEEFSIPTYSRI